jgi:hypothetical protein
MIKQRKLTAKTKKLRKSLKESEQNLNKIGITTTGTGQKEEEKSPVNIRVRDDENAYSNDQQKLEENETRQAKKTSQQQQAQKVNPQSNAQKNRISTGQTLTTTYHPYDSLGNPSLLLANNPKHQKQLIRELKASSKFDRNAKENRAFVNDYEYFNEPPAAAAAAAAVGPTTLVTRKRPPHARIINASVRNQPKLTREQIEREYYLYDLELQKQLSKISNDSSSFTTPSSESSTNETKKAQQTEAKKALNLKVGSVKANSRRKNESSSIGGGNVQTWQI